MAEIKIIAKDKKNKEYYDINKRIGDILSEKIKAIT